MVRIMQLIGALFLLSFSAWSEAASVTYEDTEFAMADWSLTIFSNRADGFQPCNASRTTGSCFWNQPNGGFSGTSPDPYGVVSLRMGPRIWPISGVTAMVMLKSGAVYDPGSQGAVESIVTTQSNKYESGERCCVHSHGLAIVQDGVVYASWERYTAYYVGFGYNWIDGQGYPYVYPNNDPTPVTLLPNNFGEIITSGPNAGQVIWGRVPDLSESGSPFQIGFVRRSSHTGPWPVNRNIAIDNWRVEIVTAAPPDADDDGVPDGEDNCPLDANPGQEDLDGDGQGDVCDPDDDGDGVDDGVDNCPVTPNSDQQDYDGDGAGDACDADDDADGVLDESDACPFSELGRAVDDNGCTGPQLLDLACGDAQQFRNHGQYVSCVARTSQALVKSGLLSRDERQDLVPQAAKSDVGKKRR